ncbi:hypothetical protein PMAYCL1PPCAC_24580 [Pristionchus mayeri]|uniref:Uncharacterized protein n=1 Tax=Pristionchus mayeri TaxID=1317129 RepID=A0AAN5D214_9BILA|nr:hypothetical protein PMAYCL1PPCAC_24580 [Pristionchus mayeri]
MATDSEERPVSPHFYLRILEENNPGGTGASEDTEDAQIPPQIKQSLLELISTAHNEQWLAGLRSSMAPLLCPLSQQLQSFSKISAAEIAVQLKELEGKMPEELKIQLRELTREQLRKVVHTDWLDGEVKEAKECMPENKESTTSMPSDVSGVKLIIELSIIPPRSSLTAQRTEARRNWLENREKEVDPDCWFTKQALALRRLSNEKRNSRARRTFRCPVEYLESKAAPTDFEVVEVDDTSPLHREQRMRQYLALPEVAANEFMQSETPRLMERHCGKLQGRCCKEWVKRGEHEEVAVEGIAAMIRRTLEESPEEIQLQLQQLEPEQMARVLLLDWVDRIEELRRNGLPFDEMIGCCFVDILCKLLSLCFASSIYPEKLRRLVNQTLAENEEERRRKNAEMEKNTKRNEECELRKGSSPSSLVIREGLIAESGER